jgi:hypothetical protein
LISKFLLEWIWNDSSETYNISCRKTNGKCSVMLRIIIILFISNLTNISKLILRVCTVNFYCKNEEMINYPLSLPPYLQSPDLPFPPFFSFSPSGSLSSKITDFSPPRKGGTNGCYIDHCFVLFCM